jgi:hypothetical protein
MIPFHESVADIDNSVVLLLGSLVCVLFAGITWLLADISKKLDQKQSKMKETEVNS